MRVRNLLFTILALAAVGGGRPGDGAGTGRISSSTVTRWIGEGYAVIDEYETM